MRRIGLLCLLAVLTSATAIAVPANDLCSNAAPALVGFVHPGTTFEATVDSPPACGGVPVTEPGVWYRLSGTGHTITATTCDVASSYDTKISVFSGQCWSLTCVGANDNDPACVVHPTQDATVEWMSVLGETYYILVHGDAGAGGSWDLGIWGQAAPPPANDDCENAEGIGIGALYDGSLVSSGPDSPPAPDSCGPAIQNHGVWFSFIGNGNMVDVMADNSGDILYESIFCGDCNDLHCVGGSGPGSNPHFQFCTELDRTYYILVHSATGTSTFQLLIDDFGSPCADPPSCEAPCVPSPESLTIDPNLGIPQYFCPELCPETPTSLSVGPGLGPNDQPIITIVPGCLSPTGCDNPNCTPTDGQIPEWFYDGRGSWSADVETMPGAGAGCVCLCYEGILIVELNSFTAIAGDAQITLNWQTASETDNDYFDVLRDGTIMGLVEASNSPTGGNYTWTDINLTNGREYSYTLVSVDINGIREEIATTSATPAMNAATVTEYALHQNYPNPFNPETNITFDLVEGQHVTLSVFNPLGQTIATIINGSLPAGRHTIAFDAADLPSGLYFYRIEAGDFTTVKKMILMK